MPILHYDSKETVPEDVRDHAQEVKDGEHKGKWAVNLVPRKKLDEFRTTTETVSSKLRETEELVGKFKGLAGGDPEKFSFDDFSKLLNDLRVTEQGVKDGKLKKSEEIDGELQKRTQQMREGHERAVADLNQQLAQLKSKLEAAEVAFDRTFIDRAVMEAVADEKLGVHQTASQDIVARAYDVFKVLKDKSLEPRGKNGDLLYGEDGSTPKTVREWIDHEVRKTWPHYFKQSKGGGAGGGDGSAPMGGMNQADWDKLSPEQQLSIINKADMQKRGYRF